MEAEKLPMVAKYQKTKCLTCGSEVELFPSTFHGRVWDFWMADVDWFHKNYAKDFTEESLIRMITASVDMKVRLMISENIARDKQLTTRYIAKTQKEMRK